jgi:hypothetical protein
MGCIMTKDRARKRAARDRAAVTGERYVVARRQAVEAPSHDGGALHDLTHRVPGVPAHVEGGLQARAPRVRAPRPVRQNAAHQIAEHQNTPNHNQPRVLVGWQNRIARFFGAD